jgi:hypothetical protein
MSHGVSLMSGLAIVAGCQGSAPKVLLVRHHPHCAYWELPETRDGESPGQLLAHLRDDCLPATNIDLLPDVFKVFATEAGDCSFHIAVANSVEVTPYFISRRALDARWASFEEAFHIARLDLAGVLRWSERNALKALSRLCKPVDSVGVSAPRPLHLSPVGRTVNE